MHDPDFNSLELYCNRDPSQWPHEANGGFIVDPPLDLPSGSRICLFIEPSGVTLAMMQAAKKQQPTV